MISNMTDTINKTDVRPLCGFCLSPQFSIQSLPYNTQNTSPHHSVTSWRRDGYFMSSTRQQFKHSNRRKSNSVFKNLPKIFNQRKNRALTLQQVLEIIQQAWTNPQQLQRNRWNMEEHSKKCNNITQCNQDQSPIFLRRRLSAPETIMRKHVLALQQSESIDNDTPSNLRRYRYWKSEIDGGSDSNLSSGKKDSDQIRKTALLKRLWNNNRSYCFSRYSGSFYEWQHGKSSSGPHSLTSLHSSTEYLIKSQKSLNESPQHRKLSPKHQFHDLSKIANNINFSNTLKRKIPTYDTNCDRLSISSYSDETAITKSINRISTSSVTPKTTTETSTTENTNYFSEYSDSAYTNSRLQFSNNNSTSTEIHKDIVEEDQVSNQDVNENITYENNYSSQFIKYTSVNESTQTVENTNVNVISNIQLSQSTLDLIYNQVMEDVKKSSPIENSAIPERFSDNVIKVQQVPSFYLQQKDNPNHSQHSRIVKYMISNVSSGSPYSNKPAEIPQVVVPRFSALPRTASMEVNMSSGDSTDKESDSVSLADSLEETSIRTSEPMTRKDHSRSDELSILLPDNSSRKITPKSTAFFIPIEVSDQTEIKTVSDHFPEKLKKRLIKRQQKREDKLKNKTSSSKSDSNYVSASDNGNQNLINNNSDSTNSLHFPQVNSNKLINKFNKKKKPLLPSIKTFRKTKIEKPIAQESDKMHIKTTKKKISKENTDFRLKTKVNHVQNTPYKLTPIYTSKSEYVYEKDKCNKVYHKAEFSNPEKRIEILEIMECIQTPQKKDFSKNRSKIPILINRLPKLDTPTNKIIKPAFLDMNNPEISDPKIDQLIANILIGTLNSPNLESNGLLKNDKSIRTSPPSSKPSPKYQQKFEAIPEELSQGQSFISENNNNLTTEDDTSYKGKAAIAVVKDDNCASLPKGWITFYMLHKNQGSPDSTSDEGKNAKPNSKTKQPISQTRPTCNNIENVSKCVNHHNSFKCNNFQNNIENSTTTNESWTPPTNINKRSHKVTQRKEELWNNEESNKGRDVGSWSITVSGTNNCEQFAPDLEMCLRFPNFKYCPQHQLNEPNIQFPKIENRNNNYKRTETSGEIIYPHQKLPDIDEHRFNRQKKSAINTVMSSSRIEPRQTRTSLRRYNMTRSRTDYGHVTETPRSSYDIFDEKHYAEILRHLPEILTITGNAINSEKLDRN